MWEEIYGKRSSYITYEILLISRTQSITLWFKRVQNKMIFNLNLLMFQHKLLFLDLGREGC